MGRWGGVVDILWGEGVMQNRESPARGGTLGI